MKPATLSWRTETVWMSFLRSYKASMDIAVTAKAEDPGYLLPDQIVDDDLSSVELVGRHFGLLENAAQYGGG